MNNAYETSLRAMKKRFYLAAVLLLPVAIACVTQVRTRKVLEKELQGVTSAQAGQLRATAATASRLTTLASLKAQLALSARQSSPEMVLYKKYDELKVSLGASDISMGTIEKKGGESSLQFSATFSDLDFNTLLNTVSTVHGNTFPLTPISTIAVTGSDAKSHSGVTYKITGKIIVGDRAKP